MTEEQRERLNMVGQELNSALATWIDEANYIYTDFIDRQKQAPKTSMIKFANQDFRYNGHRMLNRPRTFQVTTMRGVFGFVPAAMYASQLLTIVTGMCREGVEEPDLDDEDTWFFHLCKHCPGGHASLDMVRSRAVTSGNHASTNRRRVSRRLKQCLPDRSFLG